MLRRRQHRILKKRPRTAAVRIAGGNQHAFAGANLAPRIPCLGKRWRSITAGKVFLHVGIAQAGPAARRKLVNNSQDDVTPALTAVEDAGAIAEPALRRLQLANAIAAKIKRQN